MQLMQAAEHTLLQHKSLALQKDEAKKTTFLGDLIILAADILAGISDSSYITR